MGDGDNKVNETEKEPVSGQDADGELWDFVTKGVNPINRRDVLFPDDRPVKKPRKAAKPKAPERGPDAPAASKRDMSSKSTPSPDVANGLDRRTAEKLRRGQMPLEGRIDLHGMTQAEAQKALIGFISAQYARGARCVLVITGKGSDGLPDAGGRTKKGGILKKRVPEWLAGPGLVDKVLSHALAKPKHGGGGALYVLLRRSRS